jgi:hypothetical protein
VNLSDGVVVITAPQKPKPEPTIVAIFIESHDVFASKTLEKKSKDFEDDQSQAN